MPRMTNKIEPHGNGYRVRIMVDKKTHYISGRTKREVQQRLAEFRTNSSKGILPPREKLTLREYADRWLDVAKHSVRPTTHAFYEYLLETHVLPSLGTSKLAAIQPSQVQNLYSNLLAKGLSAQTVHHVHTVLHTCIEQAVRWDLVPRNVVKLVDPPKVERKPAQYLSDEEQDALLDAAAGTRWEPLIVLGLATGMRIGELLGLKWSDLDLDQGTVRIERSLGRDGQFHDTKTAAGRRELSLDSHTVTVLKAQRTNQIAERLTESEWEDQNLVFCTHQGRPLMQRNVLRAYHQLLEKAGLSKRPIHALRHTNASNWLRRGIHPKKVQSRLGHSNIAVTMDRYSHLSPGFDREDVELVAARRGRT